MRRLIVTLGVSIACFSNASVVFPARLEGGIASVATTEAGVLYIRISGFPSSAGGVKIALYNSREAYAHRRGSLRKAYLPITHGASEWILDGLPPGEYAVTFYHDANGNRELDRNRLGFPTEPFGFSNNAKPRLGLPPFEQVKFVLSGPVTTIELRAQAG